MPSYPPAMQAKLRATLHELSNTELLALVDDVKHKPAAGRELLAAELKRRISPKKP